MGRIDNRTVLVTAGSTLWWPEQLTTFRVRTTSVSRKMTFLSLQRPGHHYKMDKCTQGLPRHPLGAGLGLGSRDKLAVSDVNNSFHSILVYSHRRSHPHNRPVSLPTCTPHVPWVMQYAWGLLGNPFPARMFTLWCFGDILMGIDA
jgi:hypothetical protein